MLKHLISLVFLFVALQYTYVYSDTNSIILPKSKPNKLSIAVKKEKISIIIPLKKPEAKIKAVKDNYTKPS